MYVAKDMGPFACNQKQNSDSVSKYREVVGTLMVSNNIFSTGVTGVTCGRG